MTVLGLYFEARNIDSIGSTDRMYFIFQLVLKFLTELLIC